MVKIKITPLKDHEIHQNDHHIKLVKGVEISVPEVFLQTLVTEGVIKEIPKPQTLEPQADKVENKPGPKARKQGDI